MLKRTDEVDVLDSPDFRGKDVKSFIVKNAVSCRVFCGCFFQVGEISLYF